MAKNNKPTPFLEVRVHSLQPPAGLTGLCAGYESGQWRCSQLASHLIEWLPDFALSYTEKESLRSKNAASLLAKATRAVFFSEKYQKRGEIGEILLHIAVRQVFDTISAISKLYFKDSPNDTIKGFDAVHIIATSNALQLWLGEAKFYEDIHAAIRDAVESINAHTQKEYIRTEFVAILNKLDPSWPQTEKLKLLLDKNTSLDRIFEAICIPVFLTYNSAVIATNTAITESFLKKYEIEVRKHHDSFCANHLPDKVIIHVFLLPMKNKIELEKEFDTRLKACQSLLD